MKRKKTHLDRKAGFKDEGLIPFTGQMPDCVGNIFNLPSLDTVLPFYQFIIKH